MGSGQSTLALMAEASGPSAGDTTVSPAMARVVEMSSVAWCEVP